MKPVLKSPLLGNALIPSPTPVSQVAGLGERRKQAVRAISQTREAIRSGQLAGIGEVVAKELATALAGKPEAGAPGVIRARVVAATVAKEKLPAVPLGGLQVRLKIKEQVVREEATNDAGLVELEMTDELSQSAYEIEVLAPDCTVVACQHGRAATKQTSPVHLFEVPRLESLRPAIERAKPIENALALAHERAVLARKVAVKALKEQETRLVKYLEEIDAALACPPTGRSVSPERRGEPERPPARGKAGVPETTTKLEAVMPKTKKKPVRPAPVEKPKAVKSKKKRRRPGGRTKSSNQ